MSSLDNEAHLHMAIVRLHHLKEDVNRIPNRLDEYISPLRPQLEMALTTDREEINELARHILLTFFVAAHLVAHIEKTKQQLHRRLEHFRKPSYETLEPNEELDREIHSIENTYQCCIQGYHQTLTKVQSICSSLTPRSLLTTMFQSHSSDDKTDDCCFCADPFVPLMQLKQCPRCSKHFHEDCMEKYVQEKEGKGEPLLCPYCRQLLIKG